MSSGKGLLLRLTASLRRKVHFVEFGQMGVEHDTMGAHKIDSADNQLDRAATCSAGSEPAATPGAPGVPPAGPSTGRRCAASTRHTATATWSAPARPPRPSSNSLYYPEEIAAAESGRPETVFSVKRGVILNPAARI